ncbi:MAG: hypothetical protein Q9221_006103 [Calogaya cf. arnoldii]
MLYNGNETCCKDTSCSEFDTQSSGSSGNGNSDGEEAPPSVSTSYISIPDISISSFNPANYTSLAAPTIPTLPDIGGGAGGATATTSFTFATITAQSTVGAVLQTFTTTVTIYYYTLFITTTTFIRTESSFVTSRFTFTEQEVTAVATDSSAAEDVFSSLRRSIRNEPTLTVSANGVADFSQTRELARTSTARSQFTGAAGVAGDGGLTSAAGNRVVRTWEWGMWIWGIVGIGVGVGVGMVLL